MPDKNPLFATKPDDPKDVSWGLTTADTCWKRGDRSEALKWLRRAVEAASEAEADDRYLELAKIAADLATQIGSMVPPAADSRPAVSAAHPFQARSAPAAKIPSGGIAPRAAVVAGPTGASAPTGKEPSARRERKSLTNEAKREGPRRRSSSKADRQEIEAKATRTDEIDAWPTDVLSGEQVPANLALERTGAMSAAGPTGIVRCSQAIRVVAWRSADGTIRVAPVGHPSADGQASALQATLTAVEVDADLVGLLSS